MKKTYSPPEIRTNKLDTRISFVQQSREIDSNLQNTQQNNCLSETLNANSLEKDDPFQESSFEK